MWFLVEVCPPNIIDHKQKIQDIPMLESCGGRGSGNDRQKKKKGNNLFFFLWSMLIASQK